MSAPHYAKAIDDIIYSVFGYRNAHQATRSHVVLTAVIYNFADITLHCLHGL